MLVEIKCERILLTKEEVKGIDKSHEMWSEFLKLLENKNLKKDKEWTEEIIKKFENFVESKKENSYWYYHAIKKINEYKDYLKNISLSNL